MPRSSRSAAPFFLEQSGAANSTLPKRTSGRFRESPQNRFAPMGQFPRRREVRPFAAHDVRKQRPMEQFPEGARCIRLPHTMFKSSSHGAIPRRHKVRLFASHGVQKQCPWSNFQKAQGASSPVPSVLKARIPRQLLQSVRYSPSTAKARLPKKNFGSRAAYFHFRRTYFFSCCACSSLIWRRLTTSSLLGWMSPALVRAILVSVGPTSS